jgi:hypothetical protein
MGNKCSSIEDSNLHEVDMSKGSHHKKNKSVVIYEKSKSVKVKVNSQNKSLNKSNDELGDIDDESSLPQKVIYLFNHFIESHS